MPTNKELRQLWAHCAGFFKEQEISCGDAVHQCDRVIENAYDFITGVGEIIGWFDHDTNELVKDEE